CHPPRPQPTAIPDGDGAEHAFAANAIEADDLRERAAAMAAVIRALGNREVLRHGARANAGADIKPCPVGTDGLGCPDAARWRQALGSNWAAGEDESGRNAHNKSFHVLIDPLVWHKCLVRWRGGKNC